MQDFVHQQYHVILVDDKLNPGCIDVGACDFGTLLAACGCRRRPEAPHLPLAVVQEPPKAKTSWQVRSPSIAVFPPAVPIDGTWAHMKVATKQTWNSVLIRFRSWPASRCREICLSQNGYGKSSNPRANVWLSFFHVFHLKILKYTWLLHNTFSIYTHYR